MKTNPDELNYARWRDERRPRHLADEEMSWLQPVTTVVRDFTKRITHIQDNFNATIRKYPFRLSGRSASVAFQNPKAFNEAGQRFAWSNFVVMHFCDLSGRLRYHAEVVSGSDWA